MSSDKEKGLICAWADRDAAGEEGVVVFGWLRYKFVCLFCMHVMCGGR